MTAYVHPTVLCVHFVAFSTGWASSVETQTGFIVVLSTVGRWF